MTLHIRGRHNIANPRALLLKQKINASCGYVWQGATNDSIKQDAYFLLMKKMSGGWQSSFGVMASQNHQETF